jgi:hypothetical protein
MKKASSTARRATDDLKAEYRFDYTHARPNRFATQFQADVVAVVLEPDVAKVFRTSESVNMLLRSVLRAVPKPAPSPVKRTPRSRTKPSR